MSFGAAPVGVLGVVRVKDTDEPIAVMIAGPASYRGHGRTSDQPSPRPRGSASPIEVFVYAGTGATTTDATRSGTFGEAGGTR